MPTVVIRQLTKTSDFFWVPPGVTSIDLLLVGAGGAGGTGSQGAGGGGGGEVIEVLGLAVSPFDRFAYSIGIGGLPAGPAATATAIAGYTARPGGRGGDGSNTNRSTANAYNTGGLGTGSGTPPTFPAGIPGTAINNSGGSATTPGSGSHGGGGGAGSGTGGGAGSTLSGGTGGAGVDMSANWGTEYGDNGWFGGGGGGSGPLPGLPFAGGGAPGDGSGGRTRSGGGGGGNGGIGQNGTILVKYTLPDPETDPSNLALLSFLEVHLSGGASNTNPDASLGGVVSDYAPRQLVRGNVFADLTEAQRVAGAVHYRCLYVVNTHPTDSLANLTVWLDGLPVNAGTTMAIGDDAAGVNGTATTVANETTAPGSVTFSAPTSYGSGINLGTLAPGDYVAFWVRRTVSAGAAALVFDRLLLGLQFD